MYTYMHIYIPALHKIVYIYIYIYILICIHICIYIYLLFTKVQCGVGNVPAGNKEPYMRPVVVINLV